ncbi:hypothetical protein [Enhygromyxa salina]|uniref:Uncharacterized protein n=1 Tax=Enhygromyxa salina TaxID=215803 RepID=A0A2S9YME0_9BACT|nr:hypothetical protein [Enhygromyxa salina]PRQ06206.1 hypothetical protein ENSA7_40540 [Enhygromyxa salina]
MSKHEPPFILDLTATRGRPMDTLSPDEDQLELREWTTWLRIRSDVTGFVAPTIDPDSDDVTGFVPPAFEADGLVLLAMARSMDDRSGEAIGLFQARLELAELDALRRTIDTTPWLDLPRPAGGYYGAPTLRINYECGTKQISRGFSTASGNFLEAIAPLWRLLDKAMMRACKTAASTATLELELASEPDDPLAVSITLRLRARGLGHVVLSDPLLSVAPGQPPRLRVRVGELDAQCPDADPAIYFELPIPPRTEPESPALLLRPNARFELRLRWRAPKPGRYLIEASWQDYLGPAEPLPGQTPFMPLFRTGPSRLGSGPYPIRGAMFATEFITLDAST